MASTNNLLPISISQLRAGMFVVRLDIPWIESPFVRHSRLIKSQAEIDKLVGAKVKQLIIDLNKGCGPEVPSSEETLTAEVEHNEPEPNEQAPDELASPPDQPAFNAPVSMKEEMSEAKALRSKIRDVMGNILESLERELPIQSAELSPLIDHTLASIERNNQALLCLAHLNGKTQKLTDHAFSTFCLSLNLASSLNLSSEDRHTLGLTALLHEAGWVQIPQQLMGKRTRYSGNEQKLVQAHLAIGQKILKKTDTPERVLRLILEHHELMDGSGYPKHLKGEQLDPLSSLFSVVDRYDEMVHQLTDQPGMLPTNALRKLYVEADAGKYDKAAVTSLIASLGIYPVTSAVMLNTGEKAIVKEVCPDAHLLPLLEIHYDSKGKPLPEPLLVNLKEQREDEAQRSIVSVLDPQSPTDDPARRLLVEDV